MFKIASSKEHKEKLIRWVNQHFEYLCLLNSNGYKDQYSNIQWEIAFGNDHSLSAEKDSFNSLEDFSSKHDRIYGLLSYDLKNEVEKLDSKNSNTINFPQIYFFSPEYIVKEIDDELISENFDIRFLLDVELKTDSIEFSNTSTEIKIHQHTSKEQYIETVNKLKQHIYDGDIYEINYCIDFFVEDYNRDIIQTYLELNELSPNPFSALLKLKTKYVLSASPERFLCKRNNKLISQPIKGTKKKSSNIEKDILELSNSEKERAENVMIVDLVRNDLKKCSKTGSIKVEELFGIYTFPHLHQMISTISSEVTSNIKTSEILKSCFPMGSMTGAPKVRAMELIEEYECFKRNAFSGSIGYIDSKEKIFDFNVIIRSIFFDTNTNQLCYAVGSAITYDAVPDEEYEECMLKASAILKILN